MLCSETPVGFATCKLCAERQDEKLFAKQGWDFLRCGNCGLVTIDPMPTASEVESNHDESYADGEYAAFASAHAVRQGIAASRFLMVRPQAPEGAWLDVGASTGAFVAEASGGGLDAEGLEISRVAVAQAQSRGLRVHRTAVEDFRPEKSYAVVTAFDLVEHLVDPLPFVRRMSEWLQPGGLMAITVPNIASFAARILGPRWFFYAPPDHIHYFTPATIGRLLAETSLEEISIEPSYKPLTMDYAAEQLGHFLPAMAPVVGGVARVLPRRLAGYAWPLPIGEILVTARRSAS
jgi:2-polyprenyl-3-methyl-5-hydroxy-6-metoxy-1,4-benzoquinol methylase